MVVGIKKPTTFQTKRWQTIKTVRIIIKNKNIIRHFTDGGGIILLRFTVLKGACYVWSFSDCLTWLCGCVYICWHLEKMMRLIYTGASHSRTEADRAATKYAPEKCEQHIQYINMCGYRWWAEDVQCQSCVRFSRKCAKCKQETVSMAVTEQDLLSALCALSLSRCFFVCFCEDGLNVVV